MNDLISRQAAIDKLKREEKIFYSPTGLRYLIGAIRDLPSAQPEVLAHGEGELFAQSERWIPCSDRLPENEDIYLVTFDKSNLLDNETQVTDAYWINNQWQYGVLESYEHRMPKLVIEPIEELKVIAWMPFPEPYKGEGS